jgi:hypothetical protein
MGNFVMNARLSANKSWVVNSGFEVGVECQLFGSTMANGTQHDKEKTSLQRSSQTGITDDRLPEGF